jgi:TRAP-type C4-dicarboxylate transport system permease small subunit
MRQLDQPARRLAEWLAGVAVAGLLLLAFGTAVDVLMRYAFASPIRGFIDVVSLAGAVLLSACMPHVVASRGNIAVDLLGQAVGPRARRRLDTFGALVTALFFSVMAWQYVRFALEMKHAAEVTAVLRWAVWPYWSAVAAFISLAALVSLCTLRTGTPRPAEGS